MHLSIENLSKQQYEMVQHACEMAEKSALAFRVGSVLFTSGNKIIGNCNRHGNMIHDPIGICHNVCAIHAEMGVCMEYYQRFRKNKKDFRDIKKLTLRVVRRNKNGTIRSAKPCMECTAFLKKWLPCKILYSTDDGFFFGKIKDMESNHLSYLQNKRRHSPMGRL